MDKNIKVAVLGDGGWGTTLAILLSGKGYSVVLWSPFKEYADELSHDRENKKFLPGIKIPEDIIISSDVNTAVKGSSTVVIAIPSKFLKDGIKKIFFPGGISIISAVKGIEYSTLKRPSQIISDELGSLPISVLSGPTIAKEIAQGLPASCVVANSDEAEAKKAQGLLMSERFRVYTSTDVIGVELGGALKNIIAIAAGICDGLKLGTNAKSALFTRGLVEIKRFGVALGAKEETFNGLSGIGDLLTTCTSPYSRNRRVGEEIAKGRVLSGILNETEMVAEGVETCRSVHELSKKTGIDMPITEQVFQVLFENKDPMSAVSELMSRSKKSE